MSETRNEMTMRWLKEMTDMTIRHTKEREAQSKCWDEELAEPEKPEPRNGDYGTGQSPFIIIGNSCNWLEPFKEGTRIVYGNLVDDLKALSEPLEKFVLENDMNGNVKVAWNSRLLQELVIEQGEDVVVINKAALPEFILNLRRMRVKES